tara:strand:+ start:355 stop:822 length:468 start_codon:yes stop_codon:yes gene_type:complete
MKLYEGKVYKITSKETEKIYIGSTTQTLKRRFELHKRSIKIGRYYSSVEILKYPDADIYLLDRLYVNKVTKDSELLKLEGEYQLINQDICVNKLISRGLTMKEHNKRRITDPVLREKNRIGCKKYRDAHKKSEKRYNQFYKSVFGDFCKMYKIYN